MKSGYVLLVEDNPDDADLTLRSLRKAGLDKEVVHVKDGEEALDHLFQSGADQRALPSVVLLDLKLPKVDGIDVLRRIRAEARTRCLPVVILTSSTEDVDLLRAYGAGANSYVRKRIDLREFEGIARHLGLYWLNCNEVPRP